MMMMNGERLHLCEFDAFREPFLVVIREHLGVIAISVVGGNQGGRESSRNFSRLSSFWNSREVTTASRDSLQSSLPSTTLERHAIRRSIGPSRRCRLVVVATNFGRSRLVVSGRLRRIAPSRAPPEIDEQERTPFVTDSRDGTRTDSSSSSSPSSPNDYRRYSSLD